MFRWAAAGPALLAVFSACAPATDSKTDNVQEVVPAGCNPLAYEHDCLLPYPSNHFLVDDPVLPSGHRVVVGDAAALRLDNGAVVDFFAAHPSDGFSHMPALVVLFPQGVDATQLNTYDRDLSRSVSAESPTVLIDAETGERVLHVSELDLNATLPLEQALVIRPVVRLKNRHRYVVAIWGLNSAAGTALPAPEGFGRIRDGNAGGSPVLQATLQRFERDVFPVTTAAGLERGTLQLAWDFTTESMEMVTRDMLDARSALVAAFEASPPPVHVRNITDNVSSTIWRRVEASMDVPNFMETEDFGAFLNRGADGRVVASGTSTVNFTVLIPRSVHDDAQARPARVLQYGHGFFGSREEMAGSFVTNFIHNKKMVAVGVDWWGMSSPDIGVVSDDLLHNMSQVMRFTERVHQGVMNQVALEYVVHHGLADLEEMKVNGQTTVLPDQLYFYGNSEGHILGGVFMGLTRYIDRAVLGVGGQGFFSLIAIRARPFISFLGFIRQTVTNPLSHQKLLSLGQASFDRIDPGSYAPLVRRPTLDHAPATRRILMHLGLGDTQVPNIAGEAHARSLQLPLLTPSPRTAAGFETTPGPVTDSAVVEFDFGVTLPRPGTFAQFPEGENPVHEGVRRSVAGQAMADAFLRPSGVITQTCSGACDPE